MSHKPWHEIINRMYSDNIEAFWEVVNTGSDKHPFRLVCSGPAFAPMSFPFENEADARRALYETALEYDRLGHRIELG